MNKYKLSIDKSVNLLDIVEIKTALPEKELDALLDKIEYDCITSTEEYTKALQAQGIEVVNFIPGSQSYYSKAEVIEIEKIEEPTVFEFLTELKNQVTDEEFRTILAATDEDIKFNRVGFGKKTAPRQYITICKACASVVLR